MPEAEISHSTMCDVYHVMKSPEWTEVRDDTNRITRVVIASLGRECRDCVGGRAEFEIQDIVYARGKPWDPVFFTDGSVLRGKKMLEVSWSKGGAGWWYTMQVLSI